MRHSIGFLRSANATRSIRRRLPPEDCSKWRFCHRPALDFPAARDVGLKRVEITTDTSDIASQRVIEANGGRLVASCQSALRHRT